MTNFAADKFSKCDKCKSQDIKVADSRPSERYDGCVRRRRLCNQCKHRWTTYEVSEKFLSLNDRGAIQKRAKIALKAFEDCRVKIEKLEGKD